MKPASRAIADTILQHVSEAVSSVAAVTSLGEGCSDIADLSLSKDRAKLTKNNGWQIMGNFARESFSHVRDCCAASKPKNGRSKEHLLTVKQNKTGNSLLDLVN